MKVAVIKYNAGNIRSVAYALERLQVDFTITDQPEEILKADKVIFPGVGEASSTMRYLKDNKLDELIKSLQQPVLGVCLGMQLMCRYSEENNTTCLGIFDEEVKKFIPQQKEKVPHMGWNTLTTTNSWLRESVNNQYVYFVHGYYVPVNENTAAITNYIQPFSAALKKDNFYAVQFHPEKSAETGQKILECFLNPSL
ncbi:MAG: imidazole glycerol phosphate synthase subunit HisH [Cyclobacteriaceae bacterium]|jgi:glutamine amidotransferase|nr:imidazole glycerol phosphate synthase subunit HisH [Cyclobacteriaceae bacterium]